MTSSMNKILEENLVKTLRLDLLPAPKQAKVLEDIGAILYQRILMRVLENMDDKTKDEFDALLGSNPKEDAMAGFLQSKVSNFNDLVLDEVAKFKESALAIVAKAAE